MRGWLPVLAPRELRLVAAEQGSPSAAILPALSGWMENGMSEVQRLCLHLHP